jgi:hypothetical protein
LKGKHMKVVEKTLTEKGFENNDFRGWLEIVVNEKTKFRFYDGEPEDANMSRDFNDVCSITSVMKQAWQAGRDGEPFEIEYLQLEETD